MALDLACHPDQLKKVLSISLPVREDLTDLELKEQISDIETDSVASLESLEQCSSADSIDSDDDVEKINVNAWHSVGSGLAAVFQQLDDELWISRDHPRTTAGHCPCCC